MQSDENIKNFEVSWKLYFYIQDIYCAICFWSHFYSFLEAKIFSEDIFFLLDFYFFLRIIDKYVNIYYTIWLMHTYLIMQNGTKSDDGRESKSKTKTCVSLCHAQRLKISSHKQSNSCVTQIYWWIQRCETFITLHLEGKHLTHGPGLGLEGFRPGIFYRNFCCHKKSLWLGNL